MLGAAVTEGGKSLGLSASGIASRERLRSGAVLALFATLLVVVGPRHARSHSASGRLSEARFSGLPAKA